jgi:hypothetical protein
MMSDSITRNFQQLGVPLVNQQWSWGAANERAVVLRAWQDQAHLDADGILNALIWQDWWAKGPSGRKSPGGTERLRQISEIEAGKPCFVVIITDRWEGKEDPKRNIIPSPNRPIFQAGAVRRDPNGNIWVELIHRFKEISEAAKEIAGLEPFKAKVINRTDEPPLEVQRETFYRVYDHFLRMDEFDWSIKYNPFETFLHNTRMVCEWPVVGITRGALTRLRENNWEMKREVVRGHLMSRQERGRRLFGDEDRIPYEEAFDFYCKNDETVLVLARGENGRDGTDHWSDVIPLPRSLFGWRTGMAVYLRRDRKEYLQNLAAEYSLGVAA